MEAGWAPGWESGGVLVSQAGQGRGETPASELPPGQPDLSGCMLAAAGGAQGKHQRGLHIHRLLS